MRSFSPASGQFPLYDQNSPCADELRRRSLRHARTPVGLCGDARTDWHPRRAFLGPWDAAGAMAEPPVKASWSAASRSHSAFAVSPLDPSEKTETYTILRHPEGGRKDIFRWTDKDEKPSAELEIYRQGGEFDPSVPAAADLAARMTPAGPSELEPAGLVDSKFGMVTLLRRAGDSDAATIMPWLHQALRGAGSTDFRLVVPGQRLAGTARGDCLHAEPADPADFRK